MNIFLILGIIVLVFWVLISLKTSRFDGELVKKIHPYRRLLTFILPDSDSSVVFFDEHIKANKLVSFLEKLKQEGSDVNMTHCLVAASGLTLLKNPRMNRFAKGYRLYQRKGIFVSFTMKREKLNQTAKVSAVKLEIKPDMTLQDLSQKISQNIKVERSSKVTNFDKEAGLFFKFPRPFMYFSLKIAMWLDYYNLLPSFMTKNDTMYSSAFMANLGSLGMHSAYHHLYEWGTCPHFITLGKVFDRPVVKDGQVTFEKSINIRFSFDERIDDGFTAYQGIKALIKILEEPDVFLSGFSKNSEKSKASFQTLAELIA